MSLRSKIGYVLITSLISIVIGVLLDFFILETVPAITLGVLSGILFLILGVIIDSVELGEKVDEIQSTISSLEKNAPLFDSLVKLASQRDRIREIGEDYLSKLIGATNGHYVITGAPPNEWAEHIECMKFLKAGEWFQATCYIPPSDQGIKRLYSYHKYNEYCQLSYNLPRRGVNISKIFIVQSRSFLSHPSFQEHLRAIQDLVDSMHEELMRTSAQANFFVLIVDEIEQDIGIGDVNEDYMIWGDTLVSVSEMGSHSVVTRLDIYAWSEKIEHYKKKFAETEKIAIPLTQVIQEGVDHTLEDSEIQ